MSNQLTGPDVWGPVVWHALHYITLGYPNTNPSEEKKQKYKTFFSLLADVLPCSICANHFSENLVKMPLSDKVLENKESLVKWLIDFHNIVNENNNKPIVKYEDARQLIEKTYECKHKIDNELNNKLNNELNNKLNNELIDLNNNLNNNSNNDFFNINNIYYLFGLLLLIIFVIFLFKKRI